MHTTRPVVLKQMSDPNTDHQIYTPPIPVSVKQMEDDKSDH